MGGTSVIGETCDKCGKPLTNWQDQGSVFRENGNKVEQLGNLDRVAVYRSWRMRWGVPWVNDVPDQIEYRKGVPVAAIELTSVTLAPGYTWVPDGYLKRVWERFTVRDASQFEALKLIGERLEVPAMMVVYEDTLERFYVREVKWNRWIKMTATAYKNFITSLR